MSIEHALITDPDLHEPRGAATATLGQAYLSDGAGSGAWDFTTPEGIDTALEGEVFVADGAGGGVWQEAVPPIGSLVQGVYNYDDATTAITPIPLTVADTDYVMTNDAAGPQTLEFPLVGLDKMWDEVTDTFIWTDGAVLMEGDTVDIRFDMILTTTTTNTEIEVVIVLDVGGLDIRIPVIPSQNYPASGTYPLSRWMGVFMGNSTILNGTAQVLANASKTGASMEINGWYLRPLHTVNGGG